jgi:hypothetical protein
MIKYFTSILFKISTNSVKVQRDWAHRLWPLEVLPVITTNNSLLEHDTLKFGKYVPSTCLLSILTLGPTQPPIQWVPGLPQG